ncbi:MAG: nuclease superfamily protein [candidate division NC10 bacterium]|nr:nuclease superfamily protein [candidate division NC10 bacterium]
MSELDPMPNDQFQMTKRTRRTERAVEIPPPGLRPHWSCGFGHSFEGLLTPMPFVYILRCADGSLYTGVAKDVARRLAEHAAGRASRYTRVRLPVTLTWFRRVRTWSRALQEEYRIKRLPRAAKLEIVGATRQAATSGARRARRGRE